jgi:WD40 repeat protein
MAAFDPSGHWLAVACDRSTVLWSLDGRYGRITHRDAVEPKVAFTPDGRWIASYSREGVLRLSPLSPGVAPVQRTPIPAGMWTGYLAVGPESQNILVVFRRHAALVPLDGGAPRTLRKVSSGMLESPAISRDGRLAAAGWRGRAEGNLIEVWDLQSGDVRTLDPRPREGEKECGSGIHSKSAVCDVEFTSDGRLLSAGHSGLRLWNLDDGTNTLLQPCADVEGFPSLGASREDRYLLVEPDDALRKSVLSFHDLRAGVSRELATHGNAILSVALDPKGEIAVTGGWDGLVRVGPATGEEPHLLYGHELKVTSVAVSPDGRWIASSSKDGTIRLWPMPEGQPFHTLPYDEILGRLRSYTNLRVVRDEATTTGYRVEPGPFPGWAVLPEW